VVVENALWCARDLLPPRAVVARLLFLDSFRQCASAVPPVLQGPLRWNGYFQFGLFGEVNAQYVIEMSTNLQDWKAVRTNNEALASRSIVVTALEPQAFYRARQAAPFFGYAIATVGRIDLKGNSLITDSFDSGDALFNTHSLYDSRKAKDGGDVAAYLGLTNSLDVGAALIFGHLSTGTGAVITVGPNDSIGSTAWHLAGNTGIQPGWYSEDMDVNFPNITPPFTTGIPPLRNLVVDGVVYDFDQHLA